MPGSGSAYHPSASASAGPFPHSARWIFVRLIRCLAPLAVGTALSCVFGILDSAAAANLIENSSFEAGIDSRLAIGRWYNAGLPSARLDATTQVHGRYSLRLPFARRFGDYAGIELRSAVPVRLAAGSHSFSLSVKSDVPHKGQISLVGSAADERDPARLVSKEILVRRDWSRHSVSLRLEEPRWAYWVLEVESRGPGQVWTDALQLEQGPFPSAYEPGAPLELALGAEPPGHVFHVGEPVVLQLTAFNDATSAVQREVALRVTDISGRTVLTLMVPITVEAGGHVRLPVQLPLERRGVFRATIAEQQPRRNTASLTFSVLPSPRAVAPEDSAFGAYLTLSEEPLEIMQRIGLRWIANLTSNNQVISWNAVERVKGEYAWQDELVSLGVAKGFEFMFNLEPCRVPEWAAGLSGDERRRRWVNYVEQMVAHYGARVKYWTISDEVHGKVGGNNKPCWQNVQDYASWHAAGYDAIKQSNPRARVIMNASPELFRDVLPVLPAGKADILAGNYYHAPELMKRIRGVAAQYGFGEIWAPGVGRTMHPFYREHLGPARDAQLRTSYWRDESVQLAKNVVQTFAYGTRRLFHYTATYVGNTNAYSLFESDSGLKPNGVQLGALIWLLDGFHAAREVDLRRPERQLQVYRLDRNDGNSVFALWGASAESQALHLPRLPAGLSVRVFDQFTNPLALQQAGAGARLSLQHEVVFFLVASARADSLEKALQGAQLTMSALPSGTATQVAGRYARVDGLRDDVPRSKPNMSLWYRSDARGWIEVLRFRSSVYPPEYRVTADGFEIRWDFERPPGRFFLGAGMFPGELIDDAQIWSSRPAGGIPAWETGVIDLHSGISAARASQPPANLPSRPAARYAHVLRLKNGLRAVIETDVAPADAADQQAGWWQILLREGGQTFLHRYFPEGSPGRIRIRTRLSLVEESDRGQRR